MNKGKNFNGGHTTVEALGASIASFLLQEGKVVIPELGYLEVKEFPGKRAVLFRATANTTLFLASEGSLQSFIYNDISVPLQEGKVVTLPEVGIFTPMKKSDGSYRVSYTISSALRKLLNDAKETGNEAKRPEVPVAPVILEKADIEKTLNFNNAESAVEKQSVEKEKEQKEKETVREVVAKKAAVENTNENKATDEKEKTREKIVVSVPKQETKQETKQEIKVDRKTPSYIRNTSKVGDLVVPQEGKENNETRMRGMIAAAIAALIVLVVIAWYFVPGSKNKDNDHVFVTGNTKTTLVIDQSNESTKSYKSIDLPSLAERKYGNRIFWVYIYEANRDIISSPVNIPAGTELRIPDLWEDYKVDVLDSMEIKRAGMLSDIMLKQKIQL